jgi:hypothetical protein
VLMTVGLTTSHPGEEQGGVGVRGQVQNRVEAGVSNGKGMRPPAGRWRMGNQGVSLSRLILCELGWEVNADCLSGSRDLC